MLVTELSLSVSHSTRVYWRCPPENWQTHETIQVSYVPELVFQSLHDIITSISGHCPLTYTINHTPTAPTTPPTAELYTQLHRRILPLDTVVLRVPPLVLNYKSNWTLSQFSRYFKEKQIARQLVKSSFHWSRYGLSSTIYFCWIILATSKPLSYLFPLVNLSPICSH